MIDPRISMMVQQASVAPAINTFMQMREQQRQLQFDPLRKQQMQLSNQAQQQQIGMNEQTASINDLNIQQVQQQQNMQQAAQLYEQTKGIFAQKDPELLKQAIASSSIPEDGKQEAVQLIDNGRIDVLEQTLKGASDWYQQNNSTVSKKSYAPVTDPNTGQVSIPTFNPNTGETDLVPIEGLIQETPSQKREADVKKQEQSKAVELKAKRTSDITREMGDRNRSAARSQRPLKQALKLVSSAEQGLTGSAKLQLSRLLPGIDASDEAALSATLNQLALEQLQQFKGPTTDFEFGITQNIAGTLGQSREANEARIKSLDRNNWFNQREFVQFQNHIASGGDPDSFRFNFGEPMKTKKGVFTLQDIQDTAVENNLTIEETIKRLNK